MNILVSNDDGINAEGIRRLAETLSSKGDVFVFAPDVQRSANSQALSIHEDIIIRRIPADDFTCAKEAYSGSGTPAELAVAGNFLHGPRPSRQCQQVYFFFLVLWSVYFSFI